MKELLAMIHWLHLLASAVWVGGIAFILFVALPSAKVVMGDEAGRLMGEIGRRFTPVVNIGILLLLVTGIALTGLYDHLPGIAMLAGNWPGIIILKHVVVLAMIVVHFYRGVILTPRIARTISPAEKGKLQKFSLNLVRLNFCLGVAVLLPGALSNIF